MTDSPAGSFSCVPQPGLKVLASVGSGQWSSSIWDGDKLLGLVPLQVVRDHGSRIVLSGVGRAIASGTIRSQKFHSPMGDTYGPGRCILQPPGTPVTQPNVIGWYEIICLVGNKLRINENIIIWLPES